MHQTIRLNLAAGQVSKFVPIANQDEFLEIARPSPPKMPAWPPQFMQVSPPPTPASGRRTRQATIAHMAMSLTKHQLAHLG
jgi:hypothetical protein